MRKCPILLYSSDNAENFSKTCKCLCNAGLDISLACLVIDPGFDFELGKQFESLQLKFYSLKYLESSSLPKIDNHYLQIL